MRFHMYAFACRLLEFCWVKPFLREEWRRPVAFVASRLDFVNQIDAIIHPHYEQV